MCSYCLGSSDPTQGARVETQPMCLCIVGSSDPPQGPGWKLTLYLCIVGSSDPPQGAQVGGHPLCLCIVGSSNPPQGARVEARALREARGEDAADHSAERREDLCVRREQREVRERVRRGHRGVGRPQ